MNIKDSLQKGFDSFFGFLPNLLGFLVLLLVGYVVAKIVSAVVRKGLQKLGLDQHLHGSDANKYVDRVLPGASPSAGIARVVFWLIFVFFVTSAVGALKIPAVTTFMNQVLAYLPNVIVAIVIFVLAAIVAGAVAAGAAKLMGDTPTGKVVATVGPALVMVIALFMILDQLRIAETIVTIAFAATMGALALGLALAFGLGGRDVAKQVLEEAYARRDRIKEQVADDARTGRDRAESLAQGSGESSGSDGSGARTSVGSAAGASGTTAQTRTGR